jgi:hypothetical protein
VLKPLTERAQSLWEVANYVIALLALVAVAAVWNLRRQSERPLELLPADAIAGDQREVKS